MKGKQAIAVIIIILAIVGFILIKGQVDKKKAEKLHRSRMIEEMKSKKRSSVVETMPGASTPGAPVTLTKEFVEPDRVPLARLFVKNTSTKAIKSFEAKIFCFDGTGNPVREKFTKEPYMGVFYNEKIAPLASIGEKAGWRLKGFEATRKIRINLYKVTFSDGSQWTGDAVLDN